MLSELEEGSSGRLQHFNNLLGEVFVDGARLLELLTAISLEKIGEILEKSFALKVAIRPRIAVALIDRCSSLLLKVAQFLCVATEQLHEFKDYLGRVSAWQLL